MLIGIDGRPFYGQTAGTGRYVTELCRQLDEALPEARFRVYANRPVRMPAHNNRWSVCEDHTLWGRRLPASVWYWLRAGRLAAKDGVNVFWGAANFLPLDLPAAVPSVLTVYDFVFRLFPETLTRNNRVALQCLFKPTVERATRVVTISQGTADRLQQWYGRKADAVVRPAAAPWFAPPQPTQWAAWQRPAGMERPFVLSVSTLEPRKNLTALIQALLQLRAAGHLLDHVLVLVGQNGWRNAGLNKHLEDARRHGLPIVQLGHVPDGDLPMLYAAADVVVMPSLYEGFGIPVLEAVRCGASVVASDVPEMREAGGNVPTYVQPNAAGIASGILQALQSRGSELNHNVTGPAWSWAEEGQRMAEVFRSLK